MTWIIPKSLTSPSAPDTEELISDFTEQSEVCARLLMLRSRVSPAQTWSQKWSRDSWTQHLSGRILKPSLGKSFAGRWTSSLEAFLVNHSPQQENAKETKTLGISSPTFWTELESADLPLFSLRTLKESCPPDSQEMDGGILPAPQFCSMSSESWKGWVTEQRQEYSLRLKSEHHTNGSASSSWPTATTRDYKGAYRPESMIRSDGKSRAMDTLDQAVVTVASWPTPTVAEAGKISNQPNYGQVGLSNHPAIQGEVTRDKYEKRKNGHPAQENPSMSGNHLGLWHTPTQAPEAPNTNSRRAVREGRQPKGQQHSLLAQAQQSWPTPQTMDVLPVRPVAEFAESNRTRGGRKNRKALSNLREAVHSPVYLRERQQNGKLNPRWVETLMGLPIGWVMPSCMSPVTIAPTNYASLETEWCRQQQSMHSEPCLKD